MATEGNKFKLSTMCADIHGTTESRVTTVDPVSYTHLDVYKRQEEVIVCHVDELQILGIHNYENVMAAVATVSYTHLDVYKRQQYYLTKQLMD